MGSIRFNRIAVPLSIAAFAVPAGAQAMVPKDYSKNGATGDYAPQVVHKDYSKNGATGDFAPAKPITTPVVRIVRQDQQSFAWGDAALGAGSTLTFVLFFGLTARRVRRRRIPAPTPARPSAA